MISTKNVTTPDNSSDFIKSIIAPGNHELKINKVYLKPEANPEFGVKLILAVETKVIGGTFKGFQIDPKNPAEGNYLGQVGNLAYSKWGYKDFLTSGGVQINRDEEILKAIKTICDTLKLGTWFDDADGKYATIEAFVEGFNKDAPFTNVWAHYCVAGREYSSKDGKHVNHELFLPRDERTLGKAFSLNADKVQKFFYSTHVEPLKPKADQATSKIPEQTVIQNEKTLTTDLGTVLNVGTESTKEQRDLDFLKSLDEPAKKEEPVRPKVTSAAEASFMSEGKQKIETPFSDEMDKESEKSSDIVTDGSEKMPWD